MATEWGPLQSLIGVWKGDDGTDWAFSHARGELAMTPYTERASFTPFGPVLNGRQHLYGLDYRSAMWRGDESIPFHSEVGYWLWDDNSGEILKGFVVPRGVVVLAGGTARGDAVRFSLDAARGSCPYSMAENRYLAKRASSCSYRLDVEVHPDGSWSYDEVTTLKISEIPEPFAHTDRNTMRRA